VLCFLLVAARCRENAVHAGITFIAGILVERTLGAHHGNLAGPGLGESGWVIHGKAIQKGVGIAENEALREVQVFVRSTKPGQGREIRGVDDQRLALPCRTCSGRCGLPPIATRRTSCTISTLIDKKPVLCTIW
jgi:hypothetical protein